MAHDDFRTDEEIRGIEAAQKYRPELERLDREIKKRGRTIKKKDKQILSLKEQLTQMRLKLDDALDAAQGL